MVPPHTAWRRRIERYLTGERSLELNPRERLRPVSDGVDFLGYIVRRDYRLVRRRVAAALKARLRDCRELLVSEQTVVVTYRFDAADLDRLRVVPVSYLGHFKRPNAFKLWHTLWRQHAWLAVYFAWDAASHRLEPRCPMPKALTNLRAQYAWVRGRYPGNALLFRKIGKQSSVAAGGGSRPRFCPKRAAAASGTAPILPPGPERHLDVQESAHYDAEA